MNFDSFKYLRVVRNTPKKELLQVKGLSEAKVEKMRDAGSKISPFVAFKNAKQIQTERTNTIAKVSSGSTQLDEMIGGGFETGNLTEIYGEFRTGKTQLIYNVNCAASFNANMISKD